MITIVWGKTDKSVLQYDFEGSWDIEDMIEALDAGVSVTDKYDHDIDVLVNLTKSGMPNLFGLDVNKAFGRAFNRTEEHMEQSDQDSGMVVIVSKNPIIRNSLSAMLRVYDGLGDRLALANTVDEGLQLIANFRHRDERVLSA